MNTKEPAIQNLENEEAIGKMKSIVVHLHVHYID